MAGFQSNVYLWLLLLAVSSSPVKSTHRTWYPGVVINDDGSGDWSGTVCVHYPDEAPECGWRMELSFSKNLLYAMSTDSTLHYIGNPSNYYIFSNNTSNGNLTLAGEPYCLTFNGAYSSDGELDFSARMHCICRYST